MTSSTLAEATQRFLQEIWNEAVVTGKKESDEISTIAWRHLNEESSRSVAAKTLYDQGLRLAHPQDTNVTSNFDTGLSKITLYRGEIFTPSFPELELCTPKARKLPLDGS